MKTAWILKVLLRIVKELLIRMRLYLLSIMMCYD